MVGIISICCVTLSPGILGNSLRGWKYAIGILKDHSILERSPLEVGPT